MKKVLSKNLVLCWSWAFLLILQPLSHAYSFTLLFQEVKSEVAAVTPTEKKQTKRSRHEIPLLQALKELNRKRGVYFLYTDKTIGETMVPDIAHPKAELEIILSELLAGSTLHFTKINDKTFVILDGTKKQSTDPELSSKEDGSERFVTDSMYHVAISDIAKGVVTNLTGLPLSGVSVTVRGSSRGTITDEKGTFSIEANRDNILDFTSVGYKDRNYIVRDPSEPIAISLPVAQKVMTEVVMTALGIKKQMRALGYATTESAGSEYSSSRDMNFGNALSGKVAGVNVSGDATGPYGSSRVVIRGNSSLNGNNQPLYVIDGIPFDNTNQGGYSGQYGGVDYGDGLSNINPDNIESIQVLKGVAASALYGYRGGNGAILITTKSGANAKGYTVEFNDNLSANFLINETNYQYVYGQGLNGFKPMSQGAAIAAPYYSWGAKMDGSTVLNFLGDTVPYLPQHDHFSAFYQTGWTNQSSLALSRSDEHGHFRVAFSDTYLRPIIPNSNMTQQGVNINSGYVISPKLQLNFIGNYVSESVKNRASLSDNAGNAIASTLYLANSFDMKWLRKMTSNDTSELLPGNDNYFENPYFVAYKYQNQTTRNRLTGGVTLRYNVKDWLYTQGQVTLDGYTFNVTNITPTGTGYAGGGNLTQYELDYRELNENFLVGLDKRWGTSFHLRADVGGSSQDNITQDFGLGVVPTLVEGVTLQRAVGPFEVPFVYSASNVNPQSRPYQHYYAHYRVNSLYGNVDLGFKGMLYLTLTGRNDWFSTLDINSDTYFYPSYSGSFVFSDAWKMPQWISYGKLRASFAKASNGTSPYQNMQYYGTQGYVTASGQLIGTVTQSNIPNANLKPVIIQETEVGTNLQFIHDRLGFDLTFYDKQTKDDILPVTISATSGYMGATMNVGAIRNRGVEVLLSGKPIVHRKFAWETSLNFGYNQSKVLYLGPNIQSVNIYGALARWGSEVTISNVVGKPYGQIMGFDYKRDPTSGKIIFGSNGEPEQTGVVPLGSGNYPLIGGWRNDFQWGPVSCSILLDYKFGARIYSQTNLLLYYYGLQKATLQGRGPQGYVGKGINEEGSPNTVAVPAQQYFQDISASGADHIASAFVYNASFVKLRAITLGYDLPGKWFGHWGVQSMRFSVVGRNLLTLLKYTPNIDPESNINATNGQGLELSSFPSTRSLGMNLNIRLK
jgi:TonB-linked SusC/RagA family outer membrane protein